MVGYWNDPAATRDEVRRPLAPHRRPGAARRRRPAPDRGAGRRAHQPGRREDPARRGRERHQPPTPTSSRRPWWALPDRDLGRGRGGRRGGAGRERDLDAGRSAGSWPIASPTTSAPPGSGSSRPCPRNPNGKVLQGRGPPTAERRPERRPSGACQEAPAMAFRTSAAYLAALGRSTPSSTAAASASPTRASYEGFAPTRHCWGTWIYDCVRDPEVQRALPRIVSIDGAALPSLLVHPGNQGGSPRQHPGRAPGLARLPGRRLRDHRAGRAGRPLRGRLHPRARGKGRVPRARAELRPALPAGADHDRRRPSPTPRGTGASGPPSSPTRRRTSGSSSGAPTGSSSGAARCTPRARVAAEELIVAPTRAMRKEDADYAVSFAIPVDAPGVKLIAREAHGMKDPETSPMTRRDQLLETLHDLRGRVRAVGARVPVRRVATLRRHGQHLRQRQPPGLPGRRRRQARHLHRRGAPHRRAQRRGRRPSHPGQDHRR